MATHRCQICGATFATPSECRRHVQTSHPARAPSAADIERALGGIAFPAGREALVAQARAAGEDDAAEAISGLPGRDYRDAADVAQALGASRAHKPDTPDAPGRRGGAAALRAPSAARIAQLLEGVSFPASAADLRRHANPATDAEKDRLEALPDRRYSSMADVTKALSEASGSDEAD